MHYVDQGVTVQGQITDISRGDSVESVWKAPLDYYYVSLLCLFLCSPANKPTTEPQPNKLKTQDFATFSVNN